MHRFPVALLMVFAAPAGTAGARAPARDQTAPAATKAWTPPRTPDGRPDLQGVWLSNTATPVQRPTAFEGRALMTDEELARLKARAAEIFANGGSDFARATPYSLPRSTMGPTSSRRRPPHMAPSR